MGLPHSPSTQQYPPSLQLKLYQAFIFSVPILFTIILFLLFYLFYLKRRRPSSSSELLPTSRFTQATTVLSLPFEVGLEKDFTDDLPVIIFNEEDSSARDDTQCSVCLGDFELKEQLHQLPSCKHLFHVDCIRHWFVTNVTCPLCRASIIPVKSPSLPRSLIVSSPAPTPGTNIDRTSHQDQEVSRIQGLSYSSAEHSGSLEGSSTGSPCLRSEFHHSFVPPPSNSFTAVQFQIQDARPQIIL